MRYILAVLLVVLVSGCLPKNFGMKSIPPKHPSYSQLIYAPDPLDEEHQILMRPRPDERFQKENPVALPRASVSVVVPPEDDCGACNTNLPPPWLPAPQRWLVSWTIPASSVTNHPADFTGAYAADIDGGFVRELAVQPVNYYVLGGTRTNALKQTYQFWTAVTNDLAFSVVVMTTNRAGKIGAFTR